MDKPADEPRISRPRTPQPYDTGKNWKNWLTQDWANQESKGKEKYRRVSSYDYSSAAREYSQDKEAFHRDVAARLRNGNTIIEDKIKRGDFIDAAASDNPSVKALQGIVTQMAHENGLAAIPRLVIENDRNGPSGKIYVNSDKFIVTNMVSAENFQKHPDIFRTAAAHEMGHIVNGDLAIENKAIKETNPASQKYEILADRRGAIIYGNPREYAKILSDYLFSERKETEENKVDERNYVFTESYLSLNGRARMLHKWAELLEREGAADKETGKIINREKALEIFERSKEFAENLLKTDPVVRGR